MMDEEADPQIARQNAEANFQSLIARIPPSVQEREGRLLAEIIATPGSALKKLRHLHWATDELFAEVAPFVACQRKCNACCHYNVHLYPLESDLIEKRTGKARSRSNFPPRDFTGTACVFLKEGECSIYDVRPMACRKHVALTNSAYWCAPERSESIQLPMANFSQVNSAFEYVIEKDGRHQFSDIRQVFEAELTAR